jgi:hypothetical protein
MNNNDHLDPDQTDETHLHYHHALLSELENLDTGRWQYDEIDCCWTGKYADLDSSGYQGLHLDRTDDKFAYATAHIGKTFCGTDVTLNVPQWVDEENSGDTYQRVISVYMDHAQEIVCGCNVPGDWSGDDWFLSDTESCRVPLVFDGDGQFDPAATATALIAECENALKGIEKELVLADQMMEHLAGWRTFDKDGNPTQHPAGSPCEGSAWDLLEWEKPFTNSESPENN